MNSMQSRIEVLRPKAGDTIAVHVDTRWLTREQHDQIKAHLSNALPDGVKVAVLTSQITLEHIAVSGVEKQPVEPAHFDTWMRERTERAHADFMERTSRKLQCDWTTEDIARYFGVLLH